MNSTQLLRSTLKSMYGDSFELDVGAENTAIFSAISDEFTSQNKAMHIRKIESLLIQAGLAPGIVDLYTPNEAKDRGIHIARSEDLPPANWNQAVSMIDAGIPAPSSESKRQFRRIVFYSYKGGVGRTTALIHTAFHLARAGQRVVVIDMDVEAPGLHIVLPPENSRPIEVGLVDYLWERQVRVFDPQSREGLETCISYTPDSARRPISYIAEDPESRAQINVIPAGVPGPSYIRRLHTLSSDEVLSRPDDAWSLFEEELRLQLSPDVMLIDARTGLGDWGGLSLLRLADEAFLVLFPSEQNIEGINFIRHTVNQTTKTRTHFIFSQVPDGIIGKQLMGRILPKIQLEEDEDAINILYNPNIASADKLPVESAMASYAKIANVIRDIQAQDRVEEVIQKSDAVNVIESLVFPQRDANSMTAQDFAQFFQKTLDFERFLDDARWVVRGRKGTGKSTLFHLFADHRDSASKRARGRLDDVDILPGHGPVSAARFRPTTDVFGDIARGIERHQLDWLSFWRAYAIIRIYTSGVGADFDHLLGQADLRSLRDKLRSKFSRQADLDWRSSHTEGVLELMDSPLNGLCRDFMRDVNYFFEQRGKKLWLLYDDLDQDIKEESAWQGEALGGLLRMAYDGNNQGLHNVRFKIFLREDIWGSLVFTNKSHFGNDRTLLLEWRITDFLRLAYRMASGGSAKYRALAQRELPLTDDEIDTAAEEELQKVLAPLWGLRKEKSKNQSTARWVYSRMTDAANNTYPRSLAILLEAAKQEELRTRRGRSVTGADRLLGPPAMLAGLQEASVERVNALKNESPKLKPFLEAIEKGQSLRSQFTRNELEDIWEQTSQNQQSDFGLFIDELKQSGLLVEKIKGNSAYDYGIASLYIDGLGLQRVQGEKK